MITLLSLLLLSASGRVIDFSTLFYPLTTWPETIPPQCNSYQCDPAPPNWGDIYSTCIRVNQTVTAPGTSFLLRPCGNSQRQQTYCPPLFEGSLPSNCTVPTLKYPMLYPNEQGCWESAGCAGGGVCVDDVCVGANLTQACTTNSMCNPGLRCSSDIGECAIQLNEGEYGCSSDEDCVNTCGCDRSAFASEPGTCRRYFNLTVGATVLACNQFNSLLCETGQCVPGADFYTATCVQPFTSTRKAPVQCSKVEECFSTQNNVTVFTDCVCGINPNQHSFCLPFLGDAPGVTLLSNLKSWVNSEHISGCSTGRRFEWYCMKDWATKKADQMKLAMTLYNMYAELQENDECVQSIYTYEYYEAKEATDRDSGAGWTLAGIAILGGLF